MKATSVDNIFDLANAGTAQRGYFQINNGTDGQPAAMLICCPGCMIISALPLREGFGPPDKWTWNGNREAPSLSPSISHVGCWHGWLIGGEFTAA